MQLGKEGDTVDEASATKASSGYGFTRYSCFTLPHFLALLSRPSSTTIPAGTSLIVINCVSALINAALPRSHVGKQNTKQPQGTRDLSTADLYANRGGKALPPPPNECRLFRQLYRSSISSLRLEIAPSLSCPNVRPRCSRSTALHSSRP